MTLLGMDGGVGPAFVCGHQHPVFILPVTERRTSMFSGIASAVASKAAGAGDASKAELDQRKLRGGKTFEEFSAELKREKAKKELLGVEEDDEELLRLKEMQRQKKLKRVKASKEGGRNRPVNMGSDVYVDQDFNMVLCVIHLFDLMIPLFQFYVEVGGLGFVLSEEDSPDATKDPEVFDKMNFGRKINHNRQQMEAQAKVLIRLVMVVLPYIKWATWWLILAEMIGRRIMFATDAIFSNVGMAFDLLISSVVLFFSTTHKMVHLLRVYNISWRVYLIHLDDKDIAVGEVEVKMETVEEKLAREKKRVKSLEKELENAGTEAKAMADEIETLQQALYYAAQSAEDDTKYFFQALEEVGALTPETIASLRSEAGGGQQSHGHSHGHSDSTDNGHHAGHSHGSKAVMHATSSKNKQFGSGGKRNKVKEVDAKQQVFSKLLEEKRMAETVRRTKGGTKIRILSDGSFGTDSTKHDAEKSNKKTQ